MPAHIAASQTEPSLHSPSPRITKTRESDSRDLQVQRHAEADATARARGAGAGLDAGHLVRVRVAAENAVRRAEAVEFGLREEALVREHGVERETAVALAEDAAIAAGPLRFARVEAQHVVVEDAEDVDARERRADVAAARTRKHPHHELCEANASDHPEVV